MSHARLAVIILLASCSEDTAPPADAAPELPPDSADMCGASAVYFKGEYVDWDSTAAAFAGISGATFTYATDTSHTARTSDQGRFELCVGDEPELRVDIAPPDGAHYVPGIVIAEKEATGVAKTITLRSFTKVRGQAGPFAYDPTKAQVYVHVLGAARSAIVSAKSGTAFHFTGSAWTAGNTGTDIYIPNVDPTGGSTKISIPNASPVSLIPIAAGTFTYVIVASK